MCKRCSSHVDLRDYQITATVSKNFRTHGRLVLEEKGYMMNTDSLVGDAVLKGRVIGKIVAKRSLEIFSTATIKGTFTAGRLIIPAGNIFRWPQPLRIDGAEIAGELVADIDASGTVVLKATARLFGDVTAGNLVIESGAVFVGQVRTGVAAATARTALLEKEAAAKSRATAPRTPAAAAAKAILAEKRTVRRKSPATGA
jgi:cytoskeletal protein CcmA (bactofilin family)